MAKLVQFTEYCLAIGLKGMEDVWNIRLLIKKNLIQCQECIENVSRTNIEHTMFRNDWFDWITLGKGYF